LLTSCGGNTLVASDPVVKYCPPPARPNMLMLDPAKDLYDQTNMNTLLTNLNELAEYSLKLEVTVNCYEGSMTKENKK